MGIRSVVAETGLRSEEGRGPEQQQRPLGGNQGGKDVRPGAQKISGAASSSATASTSGKRSTRRTSSPTSSSRARTRRIKSTKFRTWPNALWRKIGKRDSGTARSHFYMAGVYSIWSEEIYSYAIITREANEFFSSIHHRVPAILDDEEAVAKWARFRTWRERRR